MLEHTIFHVLQMVTFMNCFNQFCLGCSHLIFYSKIISFISAFSDAMAAQLNSVRLKLEQRRKRIEDEKRKMEAVMAKQREKVGQEAFLRAVVKGTVIINPC